MYVNFHMGNVEISRGMSGIFRAMREPCIKEGQKERKIL
jgi:hypothetical protein